MESVYTHLHGFCPCTPRVTRFSDSHARFTEEETETSVCARRAQGTSGHAPRQHVGRAEHLLLLQEQEDPNKMATSWPDYYIDRINSMAAVSGAPSAWAPGRGERACATCPRTSRPLAGDQTRSRRRQPSLCSLRDCRVAPCAHGTRLRDRQGPTFPPISPMRNAESGARP